jgi:hypothetical protein
MHIFAFVETPKTAPMTTKVIYQCQKRGRTLEIHSEKKLPVLKCSMGGKCDFKEPFYFE